MRLHSIDFSSKIYTNDMTILNQSKSNREGNTHIYIYTYAYKEKRDLGLVDVFDFFHRFRSLSLLYSPSFAFMYVSRGTMQHIRIKKKSNMHTTWKPWLSAVVCTSKQTNTYRMCLFLVRQRTKNYKKKWKKTFF